MLIVCPACSSSYQIAPGSLGAGRAVRCARCKEEWFATTPSVAAPDAAAVDPLPALDPPDPIVVIEGDVVDVSEEWRGREQLAAEAVEAPPKPGKRRRLGFLRDASAPPRADRPASPRPRPRRPKVKVRPAAAVALICSSLLVGAVVARADVVRRAPGLASLYELVGLPVNVRGLEIADVASVEEIEDGVPMLLVTGAIRNVAKTPIDVPRLRLAIKAGDGRELYTWTTVVSRTQIEPGATASFRARLASPPAEGRSIGVRFLARSDLHGPGR